MKTKVRIKNDDNNHGDYRKGEEGYIDGYVRGGTGPLAAVVIGDRIVLVPLHALIILNLPNEKP